MTLAILVPIEVLDGDGGPLADATAALVPLDGEGKPILSDWDPIVIDSGQTDADGRITLRAEKPGATAVLAGAEGHLVQSQTLHLAAEGPQPAPFRLARSVSIRGRVFLNGAPAGGFRVQASRTRPGMELDLFDIDAVWVDGKAVTGGWHVKRVSDDGTYELDGLAPGSWTVSVARQRLPALLVREGHDRGAPSRSGGAGPGRGLRCARVRARCARAFRR